MISRLALSLSGLIVTAAPAAAQDVVRLPLFDGALIMRGEVGVTEDLREPDGAVLGFWRPVLFGPADKPIGGRMDCRLGGLREDYSDALFDIESRYEASRDERERSGLDDEDTDYVEQGDIRRLEITGHANDPHRHYVLTYLAMRDGRHLYDIRLDCEFKHLEDPGRNTDYAAIMHNYVDLAVPVPIGSTLSSEANS